MINRSIAAREDGSFKRRITSTMAADDRASKEAVAAGEECLPKPKVRNTKRKAEADDDEDLRAAKRKPAPPAVQEPCYAKPGHKLTRLPKADVRRILSYEIHADRVPHDYKAMKLRNPDLIPTPEEEKDRAKVIRYAGARAFYEIREKFCKFQAWVRREYARKGCVEVDDDFLADRARTRAWCDRAREDALKSIDFSEDDEDLKMLFRKRRL